ncbi:hypothetical protein BH11ACT8_BH11ACT8_17530 [soil metagenome]
MDPDPTDSTDVQLRAGYVRPVRVDLSGVAGPTRDQARGPHWRQTSWGFHVPASVPTDDVGQRIVEASVVVPRGYAITGWAGLSWMGGRWFSGLSAAGDKLPITIVINSHDIRPQPRARIAVSGEGIDPRRVLWVDGVPVTDPRYSVSFEMRYARTDERAVVALDMAAYSDLVSIEEMAEFLAGQNGWTGVPRARRALALADENCWSPPEAGMRQVWPTDLDRPRLLCNAPIFDLAGRHIGTPDVFDPVAGIAGEYDGEAHLDRDQRDRDLRREGEFRRHLIDVVTMTAPDRRDPTAFLRRVEAAYRHAHLRPPPGHRTWTTEKPSWWIPTETVEQRRALTAEQRRRLLGHRLA